MTIQTINDDCDYNVSTVPNNRKNHFRRKRWTQTSHLEHLMKEDDDDDYPYDFYKSSPSVSMIQRSISSMRASSKRIFQRDHREALHLAPFSSSSYSSYEPPLQDLDEYSYREDHNNAKTLQSQQLYWNVPIRRSMSDMIKTQDPISTTRARDAPITRQLNEQDNPAKDLAGIFSYGFCCCQCVRTQEVGITENFGNFQDILYPGFYCFAWPFTTITGRLSLRIQQYDVICETKTKDDVFLQVSICVLYRVMIEQIYDAYYRLTDPRTLIQSYVYDVVRSTIPKLELDDVFGAKCDIASKVLYGIRDVMQAYGYEIRNTLVVDIAPDEKVKASINEINASKRLKEAILYQAESEKIQRVKHAEAHCEALYLSGIGISKARKSISEGLNESVLSLVSGNKNMEAKEAMDILLCSQYFDTVSSIGGNSILLDHSPGIVQELKAYNKLDQYQGGGVFC